MAYTALYRKFRPQTFESVIGQEHIVRTLKNQMKTGRVSHAYLFCGTRGTGKTSTAKIFARAINCTNPTADGEPCNECAVCKDILAGRSVNVIEIDAASNNGVDNIREIREEVKYPPTQGKYKVYIIDGPRDLEPSAVWQKAIGARTKAVPWKVRLRSLQSSLPLQFFYWHWC